MKTPAKHLEMFRYYYELGGERSVKKVAERFQVSVQNVNKMARKYKWTKEVSKRDRAVNERAIGNIDDALVAAKKDNLQIIKAVKTMLADKIKTMAEEGRVMDVSLQDFERLAKLELLMLGDPTERISDDTITGLVKRAAELRRNRQPSKGH